MFLAGLPAFSTRRRKPQANNSFGAEPGRGVVARQFSQASDDGVPRIAL